MEINGRAKVRKIGKLIYIFFCKVMKIINRKMDGVVDGREKKESTVEFVRKAVNRLSYDGLTKFDSTSYKDLNTQFGFNRVHKIKKIEDIVFGENREGKNRKSTKFGNC